MKARTKRKFRFRISAFLFLILLLLLSLYYVLSLPIWKIQAVTVSGAKMLSAEEIKDLSGIPLSENLFLTSFARSRDNLRKISAIKEFHLYRIPPATVLISLTERKPIAVVLLKGKSAVVDADGYILNRNANLTLNVPNLAELPVVSGVDEINPQVARLLTEIIVELTHALGRRNIKLELGGLRKIGFLLDDILNVKVGRDENIKRKMEVFEGLLPVIEGRWPEVEYVDVRYPDNPVVKFK